MVPGRTYRTVETGRAVAPIAEEDLSHPRNHSRGIGIWLCPALTIFLVILISILSISLDLTCLGHFNPPFDPPKTWNDFQNKSFAVGFDLTAGYGTASVAFDNGTIVDVARVEGTSEYSDVLTRLSLKSSAHPTPPYYDCGAQKADLWRQWQRYFRKRSGSPGSPSAAALSIIISKLKAQTDLFLGPLGPLELAFITVPYLPALYNEDLLDAADHAKVQLLTLPGYIHRSGDQAQWPVSELNTAYAGNGFGLDNQYPPTLEAHQYHDDDDEHSNHTNNSHPKAPWSENVFSTLFTKTALTAHILPLSSAAHFYAADGIAKFTLGLSSLPPSQDSTSPYWHQIRLALRTALNSYLNRGHNLGRVISYGESALDEIFTRILEEEVRDAQSSDEPDRQPLFSSEGPVYAAARGAALFARLCTRLPRYGSCFPDLRPRMQGW
ncbi:MAG: hypothetical protein M1835_005803 [Candelina submexicana]|nr:MAG: hypothetical protein M1835_005803 [Candelina submexicana]